MADEKQLFRNLLFDFFDECPNGRVNVTQSEIHLIENDEIIKTYSINMLQLSSYEFQQIANNVVSLVKKGV